MTKAFDSLPKIARILLQLLFGAFFSGLYRIIRFFETKHTATLVAGILALFTGIGNLIFWLVDLVTLITNGKFTLLAD